MRILQEFECENCGKVYEDDFQLLSLNGVNFCGECSDQFHFLKDDALGFIALREIDKEEFKKIN